MATYTCNTCRALLDDTEAQRAHYKTDWHRYNLRRKVAGMAPVGAEGFQERVRAQRALAEPESKGAATYCSVCSKKFASFKAYENHLRSRRHVELEKQAVSRQVAILNEKNLEKGLGVDSVDKDAVNAAIQQVIKAQPSTSPKEAAPAPEAESRSPVTVAAGGRGTQQRDPAEKPPRLQWFEQQAKKLAERDGEEESEEDLDADDWEDIDSDEELECEDAEATEEEEEEEEEEAEEEAAGGSTPLGAIPVTDCLFCPHHSSSLTKNVAHMTKVHSFFIPDVEYLSDLKGLIKYLGEKVGVGKVCLWCNERGKSFYSTDAVQAHMNDRSHCKLFTDGDALLEFADFYDFRSSSRAPAGHAVCPKDEVKMDAEDGDEEQRHQADALQAPGAVLSRPGIEPSSVSCTSVLLAWGPVEAGSDSRPFCCYFSLYFLCPDLIIKVR
uniref:Cytoplasmic 60S subunit biogenesis factor ZNF622 n=1 Tax=Balaenoptera musculus TaxID=9771 RepID=A0A8C0DQ76_BALMU